MVDIQADQEFSRPVTLQEIKQNPKLQGMMLVKRGVRLSIQPVTREDWDEIVGCLRDTWWVKNGCLFLRYSDGTGGGFETRPYLFEGVLAAAA